MKYITFLLYCISTQATAQKIEILLIGVSHNYKNYVQQDYSGIHKKIKQFKPTAFFGEFLSKQDEEDLMDYWCKQDNLKRLEKLRKNRNIPSHHLQKSIDSLKKQRFASPLDYKLKTDLAHAYYLNQDVSNAHYQAWQVFEYLRNSPDANLENYVNNILSPQSDTTGRSMKRLKTSEYAVIAFPMMQEMSIEELQSV